MPPAAPARPSKVRRRARPAAPRGQVSTNITFERTLHRRLSTYAAWHGRTISEVVGELVAERVKGMRVVEPGRDDGAAG